MEGEKGGGVKERMGKGVEVGDWRKGEELYHATRHKFSAASYSFCDGRGDIWEYNLEEQGNE